MWACSLYKPETLRGGVSLSGFVKNVGGLDYDGAEPACFQSFGEVHGSLDAELQVYPDKAVTKAVTKQPVAAQGIHAFVTCCQLLPCFRQAIAISRTFLKINAK